MIYITKNEWVGSRGAHPKSPWAKKRRKKKRPQFANNILHTTSNRLINQNRGKKIRQNNGTHNPA